MKKAVLLLTIYFLLAQFISGAVFYSVGSGNWSTGSNWSSSSGGSPGSQAPVKGDDVHIEGHAIVLDVDLSAQPGIELEITLGGSLISSTTEGIRIATNGDLNISNGSLNVYSVELKAGAIVNVGASGALTTAAWVANSATITVDGTMEVGTYLDNSGTISGNGTITAAQYLGSGSVFGISPTSDIPDGATVGGWTWSGTTDTDWNTTTNWAIGSVPTSTSNVVLLSSANQPVITSAAECNKLTLNSGTSLDINPTYSLSVGDNLSNSGTLTVKSTSGGTGSLLVSGTSTGNIIVERYLTDGAWHLVSPSTSSVTANNFYWSESPSAWLAYHTESTNGWTYNTPLETSMPLGQGWSVWLDNATKAAATATMTGTIQVTDLTASLVYSGTGDDQGWNLIGNPFSTAIDWDNGTWGSNSSGTVYVWDNDYNSGDYRTWNGSTGDLTNGIIPISQGFFVKSTSAGDFAIPSAARVISSTDIYKSENNNSGSPYVRFQLNLEDYGNTLFIGFPNNGTSAFDYRGDAHKLFSNTDLPQLYTIENDIKLSINANEPLINNDKVIPVFIDQVIDGNYNFSASQFENLPDLQITLEDLKTGVSQKLNDNPIYAFNAKESDDTHRFNLHFSSSPSSTDAYINDSEYISIYGGYKSVYVYSDGEASNNDGTLMLYSISGKLIKQQKIPSGKLIKVNVDSNETILVAKLQKQEFIIIEKVVIN